MSDLCLKPSRMDPKKPWALVIRKHDLSGTDYQTIARLSLEDAREVVRAGAPFWLFGNPDLKEKK